MCESMMRSFPVVTTLWLAALSGSASGDSLTLRVEPHKWVVVVGEPVLITATVTNGGPEPVKVIHHNGPTRANIPFCPVALRFGSDEQHLKEWSDDLRPAKKMEPKLLPPGESITVDLVMLFNRKSGFFTDKPGKYWISGRVATPGNRVEVFAPPVEIEVRDPSPSDRATWEWVDAQREEYGRLVQVPWEAKLSDEFLRESARVCDTSPSPYVEYLALFLSRSYREGSNKDAAQAARFADIAKTRASSEKIRAEADKILAAKPAPVSP